MRTVIAIVFALVLLAAGAFFLAGRADGPAIEVVQPASLLGQAGTLDVSVTTPGGALDQLDILLRQGDREFPLFALPGADESRLEQTSENVVRVTRPVGRKITPELRAGEAAIVVRATRPVLFGLRSAAAELVHPITVRLDPPPIAVLSTFHFVNHGGSEVVVYRATPDDVVSGVRVGDREYPGFPAGGAGIAGADSSLRVAFFGLLWDQEVNSSISVFARDAAGNEARAAVDARVFPKPFRKSTIPLDDRFLARVVPAILDNSPDFRVDDPGDLLGSYLEINGRMRRENNAFIEGLAARTAPEVLWQGPFRQLGNSKVEASFADQRTYTYQGREVDRQVHLGFDLAVTAAVPIRAANRGRVVFAGFLGIYGNCVVVDHGMGVQSLYAHLSSIDVADGAMVERDDVVGRSGMTGLAGGDHLHFTMLVGGQAVTPVDWWSQQWVQDRILRKFREAGAPGV
jgi:murein DD-endopeptidase MepM/ murein hydrolase activator NlpD